MKEKGKGVFMSCMIEVFCVGFNVVICVGESCKIWRSICCWLGGRVESVVCVVGGRDVNFVVGGVGLFGGLIGIV